MSRVYLRADAVNLSNSVYDTEDLSTIRGSGLMILNIEKPVETAIKASAVPGGTSLSADAVACISHGASQVVFRVDLPEECDAGKLASSVEQALRTDPQLKFATIVVSVTDGDYNKARESLLAMNRIQQTKRLRVSPAGLISKTDPSLTPKFPWCSIDMVRPACRIPEKMRNADKQTLGESVQVRRKYGFSLKQKFYADLPGVAWRPDIGTGTTIEQAWDFHQIGQFDEVARKAAAREEFSGGLDGKIALIYIDGNKFGRKQAGFCVDEKKQGEFDDQVQSRWRRALKALLDAAWSEGSIQNPLWWNNDNGVMRHRLETLLWGGDEVMWVVPAWFGLSTLKSFFDTVTAVKPEQTVPLRVVTQNTGKVRSLDTKPSKTKAPATQIGKLTYSAGLVFCHAEAPIQGIIQLAHELADECKKHLTATKVEGHLFSYAALESFDQLGDEVWRARSAHLPCPPNATTPPDALQHVLMTPLRFQQLLPATRWMKQHFPRGSVYQMLRELRRVPAKPDELAVTSFGRLFDRALRDVSPTAKEQAEKEGWLKVFDLRVKGIDTDACRVNWLHLAELWDYVADSAIRAGVTP